MNWQRKSLDSIAFKPQHRCCLLFSATFTMRIGSKKQVKIFENCVGRVLNIFKVANEENVDKTA